MTTGELKGMQRRTRCRGNDLPVQMNNGPMCGKDGLARKCATVSELLSNPR